MALFNNFFSTSSFDIDKFIPAGYVTNPGRGLYYINLKYFAHFTNGRIEDITDKVYDDFMHHHLIYGPDRQSHIDMWVSLVAFIYDFNFPESKQYVLENDYINRSFNRLTPAREDVRQKYEALRQEALRYIHE